MGVAPARMRLTCVRPLVELASDELDGEFLAEEDGGA